MTVIDDLERAPWQFDFHVALRRLDRAYPDRPGTGSAQSPGEEPVPRRVAEAELHHVLLGRAEGSSSVLQSSPSSACSNPSQPSNAVG